MRHYALRAVAGGLRHLAGAEVLKGLVDAYDVGVVQRFLHLDLALQLGAQAGRDYDKAWLRGHVDNLLVELEAGLEP